MIRVGLTGAVASGKSTVGRLLADRGAEVLDADQVVAGLYGPEGKGACAVRRVFGSGLLDGRGAVDRQALGRLVLADRIARSRLEDAVHPLVREELERWFSDLSSRGRSPQVAVVEAALLVETGEYRRYHRLVVVCAPTKLRRERARAAGWDPERFDSVDAAQTDDRQRREAADYLVDNRGGVEDLRLTVEELWLRLREDAHRLVQGETLDRRPGRPVQL